jgi:hypothetical protein
MPVKIIFPPSIDCLKVVIAQSTFYSPKERQIKSYIQYTSQRTSIQLKTSVRYMKPQLPNDR